MNVCIVYQYFQGYKAPGHSLIYELTQYLAERGHDVTVVSGETGYMQQEQPKISGFRRILRKEYSGKVKIIRTFTYTELHRSYFGRLLSFISFTISSPIGLLSINKPDVVLASSPPIFPMFTTWLVCKFWRIPFVLEIRDLWPESAIQMGILNNKQLIHVMFWMEKVLYNNAAKIIALTDGIRSNICGRGWPNQKVELVTCGVDFNKLYPDADGRSAIRKKYGWDNKSVVMYFGALGEANNIPVILRAAEALQNKQDVLFVLVGDGMKKLEIESEVNNRKIENIAMLPAVPKYDARLYINAADICLVTLKDIELFDGAIPTKLIDYMACGKPVICGVRGEAMKIVNDAKSGLMFEPDNSKQLCDMILSLVKNNDLRKKMGNSGLAYVQRRFVADEMRHKIENILYKVARKE